MFTYRRIATYTFLLVGVGMIAHVMTTLIQAKVEKGSGISAVDKETSPTKWGSDSDGPPSPIKKLRKRADGLSR